MRADVIHFPTGYSRTYRKGLKYFVSVKSFRSRHKHTGCTILFHRIDQISRNAVCEIEETHFFLQLVSSNSCRKLCNTFTFSATNFLYRSKSVRASSIQCSYMQGTMFGTSVMFVLRSTRRNWNWSKWWWPSLGHLTFQMNERFRLKYFTQICSKVRLG